MVVEVNHGKLRRKCLTCSPCRPAASPSPICCSSCASSSACSTWLSAKQRKAPSLALPTSTPLELDIICVEITSY